MNINDLGEPDSDSDLTHRQSQFDNFRNCLIQNSAWMLDRSPDMLALDTLDELAKLLRQGQPTQATLKVLAEFVQSVTTEARQSDHAWKQSTKLGYRILGYKPNGRISKNFEHARMLATFECLKCDGESIAERAAYDVYFEGENRTYLKDHLEKDEEGGAELSKAEITMQKVIRPALRSAGLLQTKLPGRPRLAK